MMISSHDELLPGSAEPAVDIKQLRVIRGKRPALHDFSVQIGRGSITGLLGPSGCGKTTLIRCIVGTQIVTSGEVTVLGKPAGCAELRHRVGYLPQDPTIYDDLRIIDNVRYSRGAVWIRRQRRRCRHRAGGPDGSPNRLVRQPLRRPAHQGVAGLRIGVRTRAACPRRAHGGPGPRASGGFWQQFTDLARDGTTLLVSSHVMDEADHCGDLLLMREGRLVAHTTPTQLREDTGCTSLEDAFLSMIKRNTVPQAG